MATHPVFLPGQSHGLQPARLLCHSQTWATKHAGPCIHHKVLGPMGYSEGDKDSYCPQGFWHIKRQDLKGQPSTKTQNKTVPTLLLNDLFENISTIL